MTIDLEATRAAIGTDADPAGIEVRLARGGVGPGWLLLRVRAPAASAQGMARLVLVSGRDGLPVEYELVRAALVGRDGSAEGLVLHADYPVVSARLLAEDGLGPCAAAEIVPLGALALLRRALARDRRETLVALRWRLVGKKIRSRNILLRLIGQPRSLAYARYLVRHAPAWAQEVAALMARGPAGGASLSVVVACRSGELPCAATLDCIAAQRHRPQHVSHAVEFAQPNAFRAAVEQSPADWIVLLPNGHVLTEDALLRIADAAARTPAPVALTWDSDSLDGAGRPFAPQLKPGWNAPLYQARDYVGAFAVARSAILAAAARPAPLPDALLLDASAAVPDGIVHLPRVLSRRLPGRYGEGCAARRQARRAIVEARLAEEHPQARACLQADGTIRVTFPLPQPPPLVSLIVPTRDRLDLLAPCIAGLTARTDYPAIEVLIADNGSSEAATRRYLAEVTRDPRVRVVDCPGPFNFAAINNRAVAAARGDVLGFVNNDVEPIGSDWLAIMVAHALRSGIGAVGAKLLYPSGLVQHAGVVMGVGGHAGHAHRFARADDSGYLGRLAAEQQVAAVTAACLVVARARFEAVGGFDAQAFPVAYNDVDLCLRLSARGWKTLWTPHAVLLHKESASRVRDYAPARRAAYERECQRLSERWGAIIADDPHYHPALSRRLENFSLE